MKSRFLDAGRRPPLRGRSSECALLDDLVSAVRRGESRSLVVCGEAGIGKSALLEYLTASASETLERLAETTQPCRTEFALGIEARCRALATGERVRKRAVDTGDELTAQERQIAWLARDGLSNPEIGARLFLSPRTVEWHLRNVFTKLGIQSRRGLANALGGPDSRLALADLRRSRHPREGPTGQPRQLTQGLHRRGQQTRRACFVS